MSAVAVGVLPLIAVGQVSTAGPPRKAVPRFDDFRVATPIPARKERVEVANAFPGWEKQLLEDAKDGPDFAGRFVVGQWTCGSGCTSFAIVNVQTSEAYYPRFSIAYGFCSEEYPPGSELKYRLDSRLLIVSGHIEKGQIDGPCGHFYYRWEGHSLKLVDSVLMAPLPKESIWSVRPHFFWGAGFVR